MSMKENPTGSAPRQGSMRTDAVRRRRRGSQEENEFYVPPEIIPDGFDINWKRTHIHGMPDKASYAISLAENGWEPVNLNDFPQFKDLMPKNYTGNTVERGGQMLMIRPMELSMEAAAEDRQQAANAVQAKFRQLSQAGEGEFERKKMNLSRSYEPRQRISVPNE